MTYEYVASCGKAKCIEHKEEEIECASAARDTYGDTQRMDFLMFADLFYKPENGVIFPRDFSISRPEILPIVPRPVSDTK